MITTKQKMPRPVASAAPGYYLTTVPPTWVIVATGDAGVAVTGDEAAGAGSWEVN